MQRLLLVATLEQRDDEARGERVAGRGAVDDVDPRRCRARDLLPVLEQHGALGTERQSDEPVGAGERLELEAVDDREVGVDGDAARRCRIEAEQAGRLLPRGDDRLVRDLLLAEHGVATAAARSRRGRAFAPGETTIVVSPSASTVISATPGRRVDLLQVELDARLAEAGERLVGERVAADRPDHRAPARRGERRRPPGSRPCRRGTARASHR